jgi:hypothetical protein
MSLSNGFIYSAIHKGKQDTRPLSSHAKTHLAYSQHSLILHIDYRYSWPLQIIRQPHVCTTHTFTAPHLAPSQRSSRGSLFRQTTLPSTHSHEHHNHRKHVSRQGSASCAGHSSRRPA